MQEIHGVAGVTKVSATSSDLQQVRVIDRPNGVEIVLSANSYPALLSVEEARFISKQLKAASDRVEAGVVQP